MVSRKILVPVILAGAAGAPYVMMEENWSAPLTQATQMFASQEATTPALPHPEGDSALSRELNPEYSFNRTSVTANSALQQQIAGSPVRDLIEVIRFDIPPSWVVSRWPRVTATTSETGMEGLRVPLVTGTRPDDLAGSLTYYFDRQHRVQRLTFEGFTGDERRLVSTVEQYFGLSRESTLHAGMYVARWNGTPTSVLRIARSSVISAAAPNSQLRVMLELNRPGMSFGLSPAAHEVLQRDMGSQRW